MEVSSISRGSLAAVLQSEGYEVDEASDGIEAVLRALKHKPGLVLLDLNMPDADGWAAFNRLDRVAPLPVIIVTARPNQLSTAVGAGALLERPMDIPTLLQTIKKLLAEPADKRLARLAGKKTMFHYKCAQADLASRHHT